MNTKSRHKYSNRPVNGYHSKKESRRAQELHLLAKIGAIADLREQVRYEVIPKQEGERAAHYVADFVFTENGQTVVEDTKGFRTRDYVLKRKLLKLVHGITIRET